MYPKIEIPEDVVEKLWQLAEADPNAAPENVRGVVDQHVRDALEFYLVHTTNLDRHGNPVFDAYRLKVIDSLLRPRRKHGGRRSP